MSSRRISILLFIILATVAFGSLAYGASEKAPQITLVEPMKDFGTVAKGDKIDWSFAIKNTGDDTLKIVAARPSCGCTVADFDKEIKPGQTGKVTAHVDTAAFSGPITKTVTVESNDPKTPSAQLTIRAVVKPYVDAFPAGFLRYNILQGDAQTQSVVLYSEENEPLQIVRIESPRDWIKVESVKLDKPDELVKAGAPGQPQFRLNVTIGGPDAKIGPLAEKVKIVTNSKHQPEYLLSLSGVVRPAYSVVPTVLNFGEVSGGDPSAERTVAVRSNDQKAPQLFKVTKVESTLPAVNASVKPTEQPGEFQVTATLSKGAKAGTLDGTIKIYTTDPAHPVFELPIKGTVKGIGAGK